MKQKPDHPIFYMGIFSGVPLHLDPSNATATTAQVTVAIRVGIGATLSRDTAAIYWKTLVITMQVYDTSVVMAPHRDVQAVSSTQQTGGTYVGFWPELNKHPAFRLTILLVPEWPLKLPLTVTVPGL